MTNINDYEIELSNIKDVKRLESLIKNHYQIMEILNEDSKEAIDGGATMYYKVKINFEEAWG